MSSEILVLKEATEYPKLVDKTAYDLTIDDLFIEFKMSETSDFRQTMLKAELKMELSIKNNNEG